jgi:hypothetical protein
MWSHGGEREGLDALERKMPEAAAGPQEADAGPSMRDLGFSSDSDDALDEAGCSDEATAVSGVEGLHLVKGFLPTVEQSQLQTMIEQDFSFLKDSKRNQAAAPPLVVVIAKLKKSVSRVGHGLGIVATLGPPTGCPFSAMFARNPNPIPKRPPKLPRLLASP